MSPARRLLLLAPACCAAACAWHPGGPTLAELHDVEPDFADVRVENSLDQAMAAYRQFLEQAPESALTPEAMRRLADLKLEQAYGILGEGEIRELPAPRARAGAAEAGRGDAARAHSAGIADHSESLDDFERRATAPDALAGVAPGDDLALPGGGAGTEGPLEAIALYDDILATYPHYVHNDQVLYQKARALDELGRVDEAVDVIDRLIARFPGSRYVDEVQFRRAEYFFVRRKWLAAEESYGAVVRMGEASDFYELALYKLGWTFYKQDLHEEALHQYMTLLDYKVSTGYDFDQLNDEDAERRIADTYRVISLSFSYLGGAAAVSDYFVAQGRRSYEDKIYSHLGEFYLEKRRYQDAAEAYQTFIALHSFHPASPHFAMRVVEIYEEGDFPKLVLESKKDFAKSYGVRSEYWRHFDLDGTPEVLAYLEENLEDLANHYHALYQSAELAEEKPEHFSEAHHWYREYLASFPGGESTPGIHYQLADLLLENESFGEAAHAYEQTAYGYPEHGKAAAAGYAAIFAHREHQKRSEGAARDAARGDAVASTLRFVDAFPGHEHAAVVLGAAVDDLYAMKEFERAIATGHRLIGSYPDGDPKVLRGAWLAVGHASFDTQAYPEAEHAYGRVLALSAEDDESRQAVVDNLAAAIYKRGERAAADGELHAAAGHFLRIAEAAPTSEIRPSAEYDAGAALMRLEDWDAAAAVFDAFREAWPDHELNREATKQIAFLYRERGDLETAAAEYERVASEAEDPTLQREARLLAGELYEEAGALDRALGAYLAYVDRFPSPLEVAVEVRFNVAALYQKTGDETRRREQLRAIVDAERGADAERSDRVRHLAARSALVLAEDLFHAFDAVALVQPFEPSLKEKQRRMDVALDGFDRLVDYAVGEVTAAATFYMAEIYGGFSRSLLDSERPADLSPGELQDYELVLEEEAFPFEERAIAVHEKNLELMGAGVYNAWVEKSLNRLATLMPGRYAKFEESVGWIESIDVYAYRAPGAPVVGTPGGATDAATSLASESPARVSAPAGDPSPVPAAALDE